MTISRIVRDSDYDPVNELGNTYTMILWYGEGVTVDRYEVAVTGAKYEKFTNNDLRTVTVKISETLGASGNVVMKVIPH